MTKFSSVIFYKCEECGEIIEDFDNIIFHKCNILELTLDEYDKLKEFEYDSSIHFFECLSCSYGGRGYGNFKRHKCKNHDKRIEGDSVIVKCPYCNFVIPDNKEECQNIKCIAYEHRFVNLKFVKLNIPVGNEEMFNLDDIKNVFRK